MLTSRRTVFRPSAIFLDQKCLSGFRFQRQACPLIIQRKVRKDGAAFIQRGNIPRGQQRTGCMQRLKMPVVHGNGIAPQLAVETLGAFPFL